eukprot:11824038-Prorocentrum_lima.AAC.1
MHISSHVPGSWGGGGALPGGAKVGTAGVAGSCWGKAGQSCLSGARGGRGGSCLLYTSPSPRDS